MFYKEKWLTIKLSRHSPQCAKQSIWSQRSSESDCVIKLQPYFHFHNLSRCEAFTFYSMGVWLWRQTRYFFYTTAHHRLPEYHPIFNCRFTSFGWKDGSCFHKKREERMDDAWFTNRSISIMWSTSLPRGCDEGSELYFYLRCLWKKSAQQMDHALRNLECQNASSYKH